MGHACRCITLQRSGAKHILITSGFQCVHCMSGLEKRPLSGVHSWYRGSGTPQSSKCSVVELSLVILGKSIRRSACMHLLCIHLCQSTHCTEACPYLKTVSALIEKQKTLTCLKSLVLFAPQYCLNLIVACSLALSSIIMFGSINQFSGEFKSALTLKNYGALYI